MRCVFVCVQVVESVSKLLKQVGVAVDLVSYLPVSTYHGDNLIERCVRALNVLVL
jgi:translation elongation factor EF-1alpha